VCVKFGWKSVSGYRNFSKTVQGSFYGKEELLRITKIKYSGRSHTAETQDEAGTLRKMDGEPLHGQFLANSRTNAIMPDFSHRLL